MANSETDVITEISPNDFQTIIHVTKSTLRAISIEKEALKKRIQVDTHTTIKSTKIHTDGKKKRVLEIKGAAHSNVYAARQQIKALNGNDETTAKQSNLPTHFTCVKITDSTIKENFSKLKEGILALATIADHQKSAFMKMEKLHITFGVMCLPNGESQMRAKQLLSDCHEKIFNPICKEYGKIEFKVSGLEIMKGSAEKARVLYAKIQSEPLQRVANEITKTFIDAGLGKKEETRDATVKLHMTFMNVKYIRPKSKKSNSFNATEIFERYGSFDFGQQEVNQIHLADMKQKDADGFYKCL